VSSRAKVRVQRTEVEGPPQSLNTGASPQQAQRANPKQPNTVICTFIPPHIYDRMSESTDPHVQHAAKRGIELTTQLRDQRQNPRPRTKSPQILHRKIYDAAAQTNIPGALIRAEAAKTSADIAAEQAYEGAGIVWHFYKSIFHRDSIDNAGMTLDSTVHYGAGYNNAMWDGSQMIYGDGDGQLFHNFTAAIDVIGHELTHGVTQHATGLIYEGLSGAINEHLSDVFGIMIKRKLNGPAANPADNWLIGEHLIVPPNPLPAGAVIRGIRDMLNPGTAYKNLAIGDDPQPNHMNQLYTGDLDKGGVHLNSGILNKAFATYAESVSGELWHIPGHVWYQAATAGGLPPDADFAQFRACTIAAATMLASHSVVMLEAAWNTVGID